MKRYNHKICVICMETFSPVIHNQRACGLEKDRDIVQGLYTAWESIPKIAERFGVNDWVVRNIICRHNLPIRSLHAKGNPHRQGHSPTKGKKQDPEVVRRRAEGTRRFYREHPEARLRQRQNGLKLAQSPLHHNGHRPGEYVISNITRRQISKTLIKMYKEHPEIKAAACVSLGKGRLQMRLSKGPTKPERQVENLLQSLSIKAIPQYRFNGFSLDFALPKQKLAILVDGCYWHCCHIHFPMAATKAQQHSLSVNKKRERIFKRVGWRSIHIWEHELNNIESVKLRLKKEVMPNAYLADRH